MTRERTGRTAPPATSGSNPIGLQPRNPMMMVVRATLLLEVVPNGLSIFVMLQVSHRDLWTALIAGGIATVLPLIAVPMLRWRWGWLVAWLAQAFAVALGVLTPGMFAVGGLFAVLFVVAVALGKRLEARGRTPETMTGAGRGSTRP